MQRLWLGNLKAGEHEIVAFFTGQGPHERDYKRGATLKVEKGVGAKYVELKISDNASQAAARVRGQSLGVSRACCAGSSCFAALCATRRSPHPVVEQEAIPGLPAVKVQDLHYGDVLFHFYQHDHFDSLVRLAAYRDQGRLAAHARDAELLRGGLYLSLGQHREAREIFERLLADAATPPGCATGPGSTSARCSTPPACSRNRTGAALRSAGTLTDGLEAERHLLIAQGLLYRAALRPGRSPSSRAGRDRALAGLRAVQPRRRAGAGGRARARPRAARRVGPDRDRVARAHGAARQGQPRDRLRAAAGGRARGSARRARARAAVGPAVEQGAARRRLGRRGGQGVPGGARCRGRSCRAATCSTPRSRNPISPCPTPTPSSARWRRRSSTTKARSPPSTPSARASASRSARSARASCSHAALKAGGDGREGWFAPARDAAGRAGIALPVSPAGGQRVPGRPQELSRARVMAKNLRTGREPRRLRRHGRDAQQAFAAAAAARPMRGSPRWTSRRINGRRDALHARARGGASPSATSPRSRPRRSANSSHAGQSTRTAPWTRELRSTACRAVTGRGYGPAR